MNPTIDIEYSEVSLTSVMEYFAKGYTFKDGRTLHKAEWFLSPDNQRVLFRLVVKSGTPKE